MIQSHQKYHNATEHKPMKVKSESTDESMLSEAKMISDQRGFGQSYVNYVQRKMKYNQSVAINSNDKKKLNSFYKNYARTFDTNTYRQIYGLDKHKKVETSEDEIMFQNTMPCRMKPGDVVYNNLMGEIGVLQDMQMRGDNAMLVFADRSFKCKCDEHGWSVGMDGNSGPAVTSNSPDAASSAQSGATFLEQVRDNKTKKIVKDLSELMDMSDVELKHGDDPDENFDSEQLKKGMDVEKEHTDDDNIAKQIAKAHLFENPDYYKYLSKMEKQMNKEELETSDMFKPKEKTVVGGEGYPVSYSSPAKTGSNDVGSERSVGTAGMHGFPGGTGSYHNVMSEQIKANKIPTGSTIKTTGPYGVHYGKVGVVETHKPNTPLIKTRDFDTSDKAPSAIKRYEHELAGAKKVDFSVGKDKFSIHHTPYGGTPKEKSGSYSVVYPESRGGNPIIGYGKIGVSKQPESNKSKQLYSNINSAKKEMGAHLLESPESNPVTVRGKQYVEPGRDGKMVSKPNVTFPGSKPTSGGHIGLHPAFPSSFGKVENQLRSLTDKQHEEGKRATSPTTLHAHSLGASGGKTVSQIEQVKQAKFFAPEETKKIKVAVGPASWEKERTRSKKTNAIRNLRLEIRAGDKLI